MLRAICWDTTHRPAVKSTHRARPASTTSTKNERNEDDMESYRNQIIAMLDTIQDARLMRTLYEIIKAVLMNR